MGRLNTPKSLADREDAVRNYEGGLAFQPSPELELYLLACAALLGEHKFYASATSEYERLIRLVDRVDPLYVLRLAEYVRNEMHLRTVAQVLLAEAAARMRTSGAPNPVRTFASRIAIRADEPMEVLAYWRRTRGSLRRFPNALRRGLAEAMQRFDAYQLDKYDRDGLIRLKDAITLLHPKPKDPGQSALFRQALDGTLPRALTWETEISQLGNRPEVWNRIAPRMGMLAILRNLRNMLGYRLVRSGWRYSSYVSVHPPALEALAYAKSLLRDPERVRASRILPFQFLAAYRELIALPDPERQVREILDAVNQAAEASVLSVPDLAGKTVILVDLSASMTDPLSRKSVVRRMDAAATLAAILWRKIRAPVMVYSDDARWVCLDDHLPVLEAAEQIVNAMPHGSTFAYRAMARLWQEGVEADRIIVISDEQGYGPDDVRAPRGSASKVWMGPDSQTMAAHWHKYRSRYPDAVLYDIDVAGYGTLQFAPEHGVVQLAGWSDRVLSLIRGVEQAKSVVETLTRR